MLEVTNDYIITREDFLNIFKSKKIEKTVIQNNPVLALISEDNVISFNRDELIEFFDCGRDINITTLKADTIEEGLKFILETKEIDRQKNICFHFFLNNDYVMKDLGDGMEIIWDNATEVVNTAFCISTEKRGTKEIGINYLYS